MLGSSFLLGGMRHKTQRFNADGVMMSAGLLLLSVAAMSMPAMLHASHTELHGTASGARRQKPGQPTVWSASKVPQVNLPAIADEAGDAAGFRTAVRGWVRVHMREREVDRKLSVRSYPTTRRLERPHGCDQLRVRWRTSRGAGRG